MSGRARSSGLALALLLAAASSAHAQEQEQASETPEAGDAGDQAATEEAEIPQQDPAVAQARERFLRGVELADAGNCEGAIAEFEASLALVRRPSTLYNVARCQERLYRYDLAIAAYEEYLAGAPEDDPDRARAEATMEQLERLLGTIRIRSNVEAEVWLDNRMVGEAPGVVLVPGGRRSIELRSPGRVPERREVDVSAGSEVRLDVELLEAQQVTNIANTTNVEIDAPPIPVPVTISLLSASVIALGVGTGFGIQALMLSDEENARDPRLPRDTNAIDDAALLADIFFITGGVLAATSLALAFLTDWGGESEDAEDATGEDVTVMPLIGPLSAGVRVEL